MRTEVTWATSPTLYQVPRTLLVLWLACLTGICTCKFACAGPQRCTVNFFAIANSPPAAHLYFQATSPCSKQLYLNWRRSAFCGPAASQIQRVSMVHCQSQGETFSLQSSCLKGPRSASSWWNFLAASPCRAFPAVFFVAPRFAACAS